MNPERTKTIGGRKVEEFYWAGKMVVYIDNQLSQHPFDEAVSILEMTARQPAKNPESERS